MKVRTQVAAAMVMSASNGRPTFAFTFTPTTSLLHRSPLTKRNLASLPLSTDEFEEFTKEKERRELLANAPIFAEINAGDIARLAALAKPMELGPGEVVIGRGDASDAAYMVQSGSFDCYDDTNENKIIRTYAVGEVFGELGVLLNQERVLSIKTSASGGKVLKLTKQDVDIAISSLPKINGEKDGLSNLMEERYTDYFDEKKKAKALKKCPLFKKISPDDVARIQAAMVLETFQDNELVFSQGDEGDSMYFVKSGSVECFDETAEESAAFVKAGEYFGELSLLLGQKRALSVRAVGETEAWSLSKEEFLKCVLDSPIFDSALTTIKEKYGLRSVWDIILTLTPTELKELAVTGSRPKKASVSRHSTLSTVAAGFFFASMLPMFSPGFYSNGFPRIYDQMLFDNVSLTRITTFLFAVVGATGTFRLPPQTPKLRRLLFEQGAWISISSWVAQDSNLNIGTGAYTFDLTEPLPALVFALVTMKVLVNCMECTKEAISGPLKGRESNVLGGTNRWTETLGQLGVFYGILLAIPPSFFVRDQEIIDMIHTPGISAANGVFLSTNLILSGFVGFGMLLASLLFEKKLSRPQTLGFFFFTFFASGMYDTIVPPISPDVVPIASPEMKQVYLDQVEWVSGVSSQFHVNEIALALVGTTIAIGLWELLTQKEGIPQTKKP